MRIKGFIAEEGIEKPSERLRLRFIRNLKFSDLFAKTEEDCREWIKHLGSVMVRTDFHERFEVKNILGEGGFARVYLAKNLDTQELFAVKALKKESLNKQSRGRDSVRNEVDILQQLDHPNIMKLYEVHETSNSLYLVCEYLQGGSLVDYLLEAEKLLTSTEICEILMYKHTYSEVS